MVIHRTAYSRSGLVGNPSDIFGGKVISLLFDAFRAQATVYESPRLTVVPSDRDSTTFDDAEALIGYRARFGYYGGIRLIEALIVRLHRYCRDRSIDLPRRNFTVEYSSDIPFGVGLGGSSAIITAAFLALMDFYELTDADIPKPEQPTIVLETETEELGITAGPQDRVIAVYGSVVVMDFSEEAHARNGGRHGDYRPLPPELLPPLFVAWDERLSNVLRRRAQRDALPRRHRARSGGDRGDGMQGRSGGRGGRRPARRPARPARPHHGPRLRPAPVGLRPARRPGADDRHRAPARLARQVRRLRRRRHRHLRRRVPPGPDHRRLRGGRHLRGAGARRPPVR